MKVFNQTIKMITAGVALALYTSVPTLADDTEIFFATGASGASAQANVLFVLDTSGSMNRDPAGNNPPAAGELSRLQIVRNAIDAVLQDADDINAGFIHFPGPQNGALRGGTVVYPVRNVNDDAYDTDNFVTAGEELADWVNSVPATGGTPALGALQEAAYYYRGEEVYYGFNFYNYAPTNPNSYTYDADVDSFFYNSPIEATCQSNHIVFLSDGSPNSVSGVMRNRVRDDFGITCADENSGIDCSEELVRFLFENDQRPDLEGTQNIITNTISFTLPAGNARDFLETMASNGGGLFANANDTDTLVEAFRNIIDSATENENFAAPTVPVSQNSRLFSGTELYFSLFKPEGFRTWFGNLKKYEINGDQIVGADGQPVLDDQGNIVPEASSFWLSGNDGNDVTVGGAAGQLGANRDIYTNVAKSTDGFGMNLSASVNALSLANKSAGEFRVTKDLLGLPDNAATDDDQIELITWGSGVNPEDDTPRTDIGDPIHSTPTVINYKQGAGVKSVIFMGTNEGYLHAFDANSGEEEWAFVPRQLLEKFPTFFNNPAGTEHEYGMDGEMAVLTIDSNADSVIDTAVGDKVYLYASMRRGGQQLYGLDVTDYNSPKLMFTITGDEDVKTDAALFADNSRVYYYDNLAQSWSRPIVGRVDGHDNPVLIFGGGYDERQDDETLVAGDLDTDGGGNAVAEKGSTIYMADALTGQMLLDFKADASQGGGGAGALSNMTHAFPAALSALQLNNEGLIDTVYGADMAGQVFRFDLTEGGGNPKVKGGRIADIQGNAAGLINNRRFFAKPDLSIVSRPSNKSFVAVALGSGYRAHPLNLDTDDRFFVFRDEGVLTRTFDADIKLSDLLDVTPLDADGDPDTPNNYLAQIESTNLKGWYIDFVDRNGANVPGEKVFSPSVTIDGKVAFSSYVPNQNFNDPCSPSIGTSKTYVVSILDGGPAIDLNSDGTIDELDRFQDGLGAGQSFGGPGIVTYEDGSKGLFGGGGLTTISETKPMTVVKWQEQRETY